MLRRVLLFALAFAVCLAPRDLPAWGFDAHRAITSRAIDRLPPEIRPYFDAQRNFIVEHSIDPDLWRSAGFAEEPPRHFLDMDTFGPPPFTALPRDYRAAVEKFGEETIKKNGTIPWRAQEIYEQLVRALVQHREGSSRWALENAKFYAAVLSHYVADAHMPLHAIVNYDGQLTGQQGVHARFESDLFVRNQPRLKFAQVDLPAVTSARDLVFDTLASSADVSGRLLAADRQALGEGLEYDDAYYERFWQGAGDLLEARLSRSVAAVAAVIAAAWQEAGRPDLTRLPPRAVQKKRTSGS